jgi:glycosidase
VDDWRDQVIYQILTDRFDDADPANDELDGVGTMPGDLARHQGGDWEGIRRHLDYVQALGATAIWISPIVANVQRTEEEDGYHGYWASDFTEVNPRFGTLEELRALVDDAHERGMLVVVDVVVNHAGRVFAYDLDEDGVVDGPDETLPPYSDAGPIDAPLIWLTDPPPLWTGNAAADGAPERLVLDADHFHRRGQILWRDQLEQELGDFPTGLRDLATERDDVMDALAATYARWVELTDVDGFRLDAVPHVPPVDWVRFATRLRQRLDALGKRRFLLLGEVFTADPEVLARYVEPGGLDAVFDFALKFDLVNDVILGGGAPENARGALETNRALFDTAPQPLGVGLTPLEARVSFVDNHDTARVRAILDDPLATELALTAIFTVDAIPAVYYGTEQEFSGGLRHASREVLWETGFDTSSPTFAHVARLAGLRARSAALRRGALTVRYLSENDGLSDAPDASLVAWERADEASGERALVVLNAHAFQASTAPIPTGFDAGTVLGDALWNAIAPSAVASDGTVTVTLPPRTGVVLLDSSR